MRWVVITSLCIASARPLSAQPAKGAQSQPAAPQQIVADSPITIMMSLAGDATLSLLRKDVASGDVPTLQQDALKVIRNLRTGTNNASIPDPKEAYIRVIFLAHKPTGELILGQTLIHDPLPRYTTIRGIKGPSHKLVTILLHDDTSVTLTTVMSVTQQQNPFQSDLSALVSQYLSTKLSLPGAISTVQARPKTLRPSVVGVASVAFEVDYERAKIAFDDTISIPNPIEYSRCQIATLTNIDIDTTCQKAVNALRAVPDDSKVQAACSPALSTKDCAVAMRKALTDTYTQVKSSGECKDTRLLGLMTAAAYESLPDDFKPIAAHIDYNNVPLTRMTVGLGSGFIGGMLTQSAPRVQVQSGKIAANPVPRAISMGVVNWFPKGFDPEAVGITPVERLRLFAGAAFTPLFGPVAGVGFGASKSLAFNAGVALLIFDAAKSDEMIGAAPLDPSRPFKIGYGVGMFGAATYNLK